MPGLSMLRCRAWIHELSFFVLEDVEVDNTDVPRFEMVAYLEKCSRVISPSSPPTTSRQLGERSFVSDPVRFLSNNACSDAAATEVLSFSLHDSWPRSFVSEISSYARQVVGRVELSETTKLRVEVRVHCKVDYFNNEHWMGVSSEERRRMAVEAKLGEAEWTAVDDDGHDDGHDDEEKERCPVCLVEFTEGEMLAETPCSHYFHKECVMNWLVERSNSCPLCRCDVVDENEYEIVMEA